MRDLVDDIFSPKILVFIYNFKRDWVFTSMPEFHTSYISMYAFQLLQMFFDSPSHKELPAAQNTKLTFVQGRLELRLYHACLQPSHRMLRHTICSRHFLAMSNFTLFYSFKSYYKKIGLKLSWGISSCAWLYKGSAFRQFTWLMSSLLGYLP